MRGRCRVRAAGSLRAWLEMPVAALAILSVSSCACSGTRLVGDVEQDGHVRDAPPEALCPQGMAYVPSGPFVMGSDPGDEFSPYDWSWPEHVVMLTEPYCMDIFEVANGEWKACVEAGACPIENLQLMDSSYYGNPDYDGHPVVNMSWEHARSYCGWRGKRLPTEAQWEKAARGGCETGGDPATCDDPEDERLYPWGDDPPTCENCNFNLWEQGCYRYPPDPSDPVNSMPLGASPYGIIHMADNVAEWTHDFFHRDYYSTGGPPWIDPEGPEEPLRDPYGFAHWVYYSVRGTSYGSVPMPLTPRGGLETWSDGVGFRCAADPL